jgi:hypothetical protein
MLTLELLRPLKLLALRIEREPRVDAGADRNRRGRGFRERPVGHHGFGVGPQLEAMRRHDTDEELLAPIAVSPSSTCQIPFTSSRAHVHASARSVSRASPSTISS